MGLTAAISHPICHFLKNMPAPANTSKTQAVVEKVEVKKKEKRGEKEKKKKEKTNKKKKKTVAKKPATIVIDGVVVDWTGCEDLDPNEIYDPMVDADDSSN